MLIECGKAGSKTNLRPGSLGGKHVEVIFLRRFRMVPSCLLAIKPARIIGDGWHLSNLKKTLFGAWHTDDSKRPENGLDGSLKIGKLYWVASPAGFAKEACDGD
jgi:hypothetical protein